MSPSSPAGSSSSSLPDSNTLLALPDGAIPHGTDRSSYTISTIGGYPTYPYPDVEAPTCGICHGPLPLLAQVYCPPEDGENDRTIYVFGCPRGKCQRKEGSVRAFRASKRNDEYVADVEAKRLVRAEQERLEKEKAKINPFTMNGGAPSGALFGGGPSLFGAEASSNPFATSTSTSTPTTSSSLPSEPVAPDVTKLAISDSNTDTSTSATTTLAPPHPAYQPPQYLATVSEYLPPPEDVEMDSDEDETEEEKAGWRDERWDSLLPQGMDVVFQRFVRRIESAEGGATQVLRYELGGVPMPYASSSPLTKKLFPTLPPTKPDDEEPVYAEHYKPGVIPPCPACKGKRVFELQLVPSLINILSPSSLTTTGDASPESQVNAAVSEKERKEQLAKLAAGEGPGGDGMEWGTIMVFGCENDCVGHAEEWVGVEWETTLSS